MTLQQQEHHLEALEQEADAVAFFVASLDTSRLCMIGNLVNDELALRFEGKPTEKGKLH
jgi:hypothetical protein